ncbi:MAG: hypothetical protein MI923_30550 [Phycisphaerales bacterium]|nr:hypothetical protein [Phycisphaerales bacterium]
MIKSAEDPGSSRGLMDERPVCSMMGSNARSFFAMPFLGSSIIGDQGHKWPCSLQTVMMECSLIGVGEIHASGQQSVTCLIGRSSWAGPDRLVREVALEGTTYLDVHHGRARRSALRF